MSKLQFAIIAIAVVVSLLAVLVFSGVLPGLRPFGQGKTSAVVVWGTLPSEALAESVSNFNRDNRDVDLSYVQKNADGFESEFINALAARSGPDLIVFGPEFILKHRDKFSLISPELMSERSFLSAFADLGELLIFKDGLLGLPLGIDPLVLYWNQDLFRNEGIPAAPKTWDEFLSASQKMTKLDPAGNILASGTALGLDDNVAHFKEILSVLIMQASGPVVRRETLEPVLDAASDSGQPSQNALRFYAEFSNPAKASYSWNRASPLSSEAFAASKAAMYFGFGSEFPAFAEANPHLNFDIAPVPQIRGEKTSLTYGRLISVGMAKNASDALSAWRVMQFLASPDEALKLAQALSYAPAQRDLLSQKTPNPVWEVLFREAVKTRAWLDADSEKTSEIFANMVKSVYSGRKLPSDAVRDAQAQLQNLYQR